ncbi:MAG: HupE/UreJ family protein [Deltaproteobacteria bacterium]
MPLLALTLSDSAYAHTKSASYSRWNLDATDGRSAKVQIRLPLLELTRFPAGHDWPAYLQTHLRLFAGDAPCTATLPVRQAQTPVGWAIFRWRVDCPAQGDLVVRSDVLGDVLSSHLHFARFADGEGRIRERVLVAAAPEWSLASTTSDTQDEAAGTSIFGYITLGAEHILEGWDHLAFIAALLLLSASLREVATLVTAFTVAHSITLGLAVLGLVRPEPLSVEILIGFSIALVAVENSWLVGGRGRAVPQLFVAALLLAAALSLTGSGTLSAIAWGGLALFSWCHFGLLRDAAKPARLRAMVAFAFGLVHGFGFAGVLMEIELPTHRLLPALFGFNIGVELGQLAVVALVWPLLRLLARPAHGAWYRLVAEAGSAAIAGLGIYWVVIRNWG